MSEEHKRQEYRKKKTKGMLNSKAKICKIKTIQLTLQSQNEGD